MSQLNLVEEYLDFLDGPIWYSIVGFIKFDATVRRRNLLTSTNMTEQQRYGHIYALGTYKSLCTKIYDAAGRKLPPELLELFTGDAKE